MPQSVRRLGDADTTLGKTATKLWRAALGAARKAGASPGKKQASAVVASLIAGLNKAGQFIDTVRREEACDAALLLVREHLAAAMSDDETSALVDAPPRRYLSACSSGFAPPGRG
jgi:hypothetical protein